MGKIEYGSVYKFLVSLGVILVFFPFVALYLLATGEVKVLSQSEMSSISAYSFTMLEWKQCYMYICRDIFPYLGGVSFVVGMSILIWGFVKWLNIQSLEDSNLKIENKIKSLSIAEKLAKAEMELMDQNMPQKCDDFVSSEEQGQGGDQGNEGQNGDSRPESAREQSETPEEPKPSGNQGNAESKMMNPSLSCIEKNPRKFRNFERLFRYIKIEEQCFEYIKRRGIISFDGYSLRRDVKIGTFEYDAIAISKEDNVDLLFEVKYWTSIPDLRGANPFIRHLKKSAEFYERYMKRNFRIKLVVVTRKELEAKVQKMVYSAIFGILPGMIDLIIIDESELL